MRQTEYCQHQEQDRDPQDLDSCCVFDLRGAIYTMCPKKVVHQTHGDNFVNSLLIFEMVSLLEIEVNFQH